MGCADYINKIKLYIKKGLKKIRDNTTLTIWKPAIACVNSFFSSSLLESTSCNGVNLFLFCILENHMASIC